VELVVQRADVSSESTHLSSFTLVLIHEPLLATKFPLEESVLTHWTFLTTYEGVLAAHLDDSQVTWAVVNSTWKKCPRYQFTTHLEHRSAINTSLTQEGRCENCNGRRFVWSSRKARNVRGSSPIRCVSCVILVFVTVTQFNKCCVYQALAPESYRQHYLHLYLAYCLSWAVLTNFRRTSRHRHFPRLPPCGIAVACR